MVNAFKANQLRRMVVASFLLFLLALVCSSNVSIPAVAFENSVDQVSESSFEDQVVVLINHAREAQGVPPLKRNAMLEQAAREHAQAMARDNFFDHLDPNTHEMVKERVEKLGYSYAYVGENIAAGMETPEAAVKGWLNSPGHRANIMNPDFRETGVGYVFDRGDTFPSTPGYTHYWVQTFGSRRDTFPLIISNEASRVSSPEVALYVYGEEWAQEMRLKNDDGSYGEWQPFRARSSWLLPDVIGKHTVTAELRNGSQVVETSDEIILGDVSSSSAITTTTGFDAPPQLDSVQLNAQISPNAIVAGEEAEVTIQLLGADLPECMGSLGKAVDAIFVFDVSDSAGNGAEGSNWRKTVLFTQSLLGSLAQDVYGDIGGATDHSSLAMISSVAGVTGPEATVLLDITQDYVQAGELISGITPAGDSNIADGLRKAQEIFNSESSGRPHVIFLMLHDNIPLSNAALTAAKEVRDQGTEIYLIANTLNITSENQITSDMAMEVTGDASRFLIDPKPETLRMALVKASGGEDNAAATHLLVRAALRPSDSADVVSVENDGVARDNEAIWQLDHLGKGQKVNLSYTVKARTDTDTDAAMQLFAGVAYLDCNGYPHNLDIARGGELQPAPGSTLTVGEIPPPTPTGPPPTTITPPPPTPVPVTLCPGDEHHFPLAYTLPAAPARADVVLAFDVSGSMEDILNTAAANGVQLAQQLQALIPDLQLGVVIFSDYPVEPMGETGDVPYQMLQPVSSDAAAVQDALTSLPGMLQDGGDNPEAYTRVLYEMTADPALGWRPDTKHFVIFFGDSVGRDLDPGRDGKMGTGDDITLNDALAELAAEHVTVLFAATDFGAQSEWERILEPIGGKSVYLDQADKLVSTVQKLVSDSVIMVDTMTVEVSPEYQSWVHSMPPEIKDVAAGASSQFNVKLTVPDDVHAGDYDFVLSITGDGAVYQSLPIQVSVPVSCAPPPPGASPCDSWLWRWALPLILPLLLLPLCWLIKKYRDRRRQYPSPKTWRCWLPCLLALLLLLGFAYLFGQRIAHTACIALQAQKMLSVPAASLAPGSISETVALFAPLSLFGVTVPLWLPLLLFVLLCLLCWWGCRPSVVAGPVSGDDREPGPKREYVPPPEPIGGWSGPPPVWAPEKTLIIGLGGSGRWILTYIKKNLLDAGAGNISSDVRLLLLDNAKEERIDQEEADVHFANVALTENEMIALGHDLNDLIRDMAVHPERYEEMSRWFPAKYYAQRKEVELDLSKGTGGQRPLGRATLFSDIHQAEASLLWSTLLDAVASVQEGEKARIMVVGSLAGGFGSASIADVAYLARYAAKKVGAKFASIEAYLACQSTFDAVVGLHQQRELKANTFAALLELRRLQLQGESFPYRVTYNRKRPDDPVWDGVLNRPLLDDFYLFDGYRPQRPLLREKPENGVFPTIADAITLHLDKASRTGSNSLWAYRRQVQGQSTNEQQRTLQAVVSSLGVFAYRLPVADIVEILKIRWAKHFIGHFVLGEAAGELRLDPRLNQEDDVNNLDVLATRFIQGSSGLGNASRTVRLLGSLLDGHQPNVGWEQSAAGISIRDDETEARLYRKYLNEALVNLLNGNDPDPEVARTGKLGYVVEWLEEVERGWPDVVFALQTLPGKLGKRTPDNLPQLQRLPGIYQKETASVRRKLLSIISLISDALASRQSDGWRDVQRSPQAVFEHLQAHAEQWDAYRDEMNEIVTRRYFIDDGLLTDWYEHYLAPKVKPHLGRLYWRVTDEGKLDLFFNGIDSPVALVRNGSDVMTQALLVFAGYLAQDVWSQETLAIYLEKEDLAPDNAPDTVEEMWAMSAPLLDYDGNAAENVQLDVVLGVNYTVKNTRLLIDPMSRKLPSSKQIRQLEITDPYTMLLARSIDVIPSEATMPHRDAAETFMPMYGLTPKTAKRVKGAPRFVFAAERNALRYEQRLPELTQAPRIFHPLFVLALENEKKAILYIKVLAAGLVHPDVTSSEERIIVERGGGRHYFLTQSTDNQYREMSRYVAAMIRFVSAPEEVLADVASVLDEMPDLQERWQEFINSRLPKLHESRLQATKDVAAFADLVLFDLMKSS